MRISLLLCVLVPNAAICLGQCSATLSSADTIGSVKAKLACLAKLQSETAAMNVKLQTQLDKLKEEDNNLKVTNAHLDAENKHLREQPPLALNWTGRSFDTSKFSVAQCKSNASHAMVERGGKPTGDGDTWIGFTIGEEMITVECNDRWTGLVFVVSPSDRANPTLGGLLADSIFP